MMPLQTPSFSSEAQLIPELIVTAMLIIERDVDIKRFFFANARPAKARTRRLIHRKALSALFDTISEDRLLPDGARDKFVGVDVALPKPVCSDLASSHHGT